eukprot:COSAG06_NODE_54894_length_292_cov_0.834197_1_plen_51_part_00
MVAEYEKERRDKEGSSGGGVETKQQAVDVAAVENYKQTYMRDYRRGGVPG